MAKEKKKMGRPILFKEEYCELAFNYALMGATDVEMCGFFGVSEPTFNAWKKDYPDFFKSLKAGKDEADSKVTKSLYQRAIGYEHDDVHISNYQGEITITPIRKHYPPETTAGIFWLKNRQKDKWRDKTEQDIKLSGSLADALREADRG